MDFLLKDASQLDDAHFKEVKEIVLGIIDKFEMVEDKYIQAIEVEYNLGRYTCMRRCFHCGMTERAISILQSEVEQVLESEGSVSLELSVGRALNIMEIFSTLLELIAHVVYIVVKRPEIAMITCQMLLPALFASSAFEVPPRCGDAEVHRGANVKFVIDREEEEPISPTTSTQSKRKSGQQVRVRR